MAIDDSVLRRLRTVPEERIVAELKKIHARRGDRRRRALETPVVVRDQETDSRYERARRHFTAEEQRLRRQAGLTDRIIDQMRERAADRSEPRATQETLAVRAAVGRPAGGRFRLANRFARALDVTLTAEALRDRNGAVVGRVELWPSQARLAPGEERVVQVTVDLAGVGPPLVVAGEIVARADGAALHRLWLEVETYALDDPREEPS